MQIKIGRSEGIVIEGMRKEEAEAEAEREILTEMEEREMEEREIETRKEINVVHDLDQVIDIHRHREEETGRHNV